MSVAANSAIDDLCINSIRFLAAEMVERAKSGHPGLPMGSAAAAYTLWSRFLKFDPGDPSWPDRDRFVLSAGHGSALLYALLHLFGLDLSVEELKRFRQWGSRTPGHPEYGHTAGVEATTGPLGQGFGNAVGMAIAEATLAARFNQPGHAIVDHYTFVLASDGDLMEGVASEAASLAGHLGLGKLIVLYSDNQITIDGSTDLSFSEDRCARFAAYGWHVQRVTDGNSVGEVANALEVARAEMDRPSLIAIREVIGHGSPNKQGTASAHGEPLGEAELKLAKANLGWTSAPFDIPAEARRHFSLVGSKGSDLRNQWDRRWRAYEAPFPELAAEFVRTMDGALPDGWDSDLPTFTTGEGPMATRVASNKVLGVLATRLPELIGGSADLGHSTGAYLKGGGDFGRDNRLGRNLFYGVREHGMGAIANGLTLHGGLHTFVSTFLVFSDYMRPPIRLAAMSKLPVVFVFSHDSLALGEDGPTHQPVEHLLGLRSVPGLIVMRPADANETAAAWRVAMRHNGPVALVLTRQKLPVLDLDLYPGVASGVESGGYLLVEAEGKEVPDIVLLATGSEVHIALEARELLAGEGVRARVVSMPCVELFREQPVEYRESLLADGVPILVVEAGSPLGWQSYLGPPPEVVGVESFGASAPGDVVLSHYGFTAENVAQRARALLQRQSGPARVGGSAGD